MALAQRVHVLVLGHEVEERHAHHGGGDHAAVGIHERGEVRRRLGRERGERIAHGLREDGQHGCRKAGPRMRCG